MIVCMPHSVTNVVHSLVKCSSLYKLIIIPLHRGDISISDCSLVITAALHSVYGSNLSIKCEIGNTATAISMLLWFIFIFI